MLRLYIQTVVVVCFCAGGNIASIETAGNLKTPKFVTGGKSAWGQRKYEQKTLGKHMEEENIGNISGL